MLDLFIMKANKNSDVCECIICHYRYSLEINFRVHLEVSNGSHNLTQIAMIFNDVSIAAVKGNKPQQIFLGGRKPDHVMDST